MSNLINFGFDKIQFGTDTAASTLWRKDFLRIGHSGASGHAQANTLKSLSLALEFGVDMVEFDVRQCRDELVLLHDDNLSHVSNQHTGILASECSLDMLKTIDLGDGERIPTLSEALELLQGRVLINVDLKAKGYEHRTLEILRDKNVLGNVLVSSLIPESLIIVKNESSIVKTGLSYPEDRGNASKRPYLKPIVDIIVKMMQYTLPYRVIRMMKQTQVNAMMLNHRIVSKKVVDVVQSSNGRVFVWTIDNFELMKQTKHIGVDGIASNYPELFAKVG